MELTAEQKLRNIGRMILTNEDNLRLLQCLVYESIFNVIEQNKNNNEEKIINAIADRFDTIIRANGSQGVFRKELFVYHYQLEIIEKVLGIDMSKYKDKIFLEIAITKFHKLIFSKDSLKKELGDFLIHVQYVTPKVWIGLTNLFQIKMLKDKARGITANIDLKQLEMLYEPATVSYHNKCAIKHPKELQSYGEFAHYWFIHTSPYQTNLLARYLSRSKSLGSIFTKYIPINILLWPMILFYYNEYYDLLKIEERDVLEDINKAYINTSFLDGYYLYQLHSKQLDILEHKSKLVSGGEKLSNCIFLLHGLKDNFVKDIIKCYKEISDSESKPSKFSEYNAGLLNITLRIGAERNVNEVSIIQQPY